MYTHQKIEKLLRTVLQPIAPRKAYVQALKKRLLFGRRMKVEVEPDHSMQETITLATVGLGAIATVAAITALGVQLFHRSAAVRAQQAAKDIRSADKKSAIA
jgi:hypothetical protein